MTTAYTRRFFAAVVLSLLLHILAFSGAWLRIREPDLPLPPPPLEARLASMPPPAVKPAPPPNTTPRPKPRTKPAPKPMSAPRMPAVIAETPLTTLEAPPSVPAAPSEPVAPSPPKPAPRIQDAQQPAIAQAKSLPRTGRIIYTLFLGTEKFSVGRTVQSWEIAGDTYKLGSISETTGMADLFYSQHLNYLSEGKITNGGLQPETFLMSRKRRGETEVAKANLDWENREITLGKVQNRRSEALPAGSQDLVSLFYQLSLAPPAPGRVRLPITNGSDLDIYELDVLQEERIETPLGVLKALPVRQVRQPGKESIEFWLAADYGYLPVKIRFIGRDGEQSGEQVVSEIHVSEK